MQRETEAEQRREQTRRRDESSYIGSARARGARRDRSHVHIRASLTPLIGAAHARGCIKRARAQRR